MKRFYKLDLNMKYENPLDIPLEKASFSVVDVETTGLSANKNRIIEIALVKIENLKITDKLNYLINPQTYIPTIYYFTHWNR